MQNITLEDIKKLDDLFDIYDFAQQHEIPLDGCVTQEELIERICLHKQKLGGIYKNALDGQKCENLKVQTEHKYGALAEIYESILSGLGDSLPLLSEIFKSCEKSDDLRDEFEQHITSLRTKEINIVIAGQTNAGKSTLLNLLLGMDILPKSVLSCTSSICKLHYDPTFKVKVTHGHGRQATEVSFKDREEAAVYLRELVAVEDTTAREQGDTVREVDIFLPATILKTGITIVDTPGFGENDAMDDLLKDFITRGRVSAFVYVIKTDSGGGVQEDRLVKFLKTFLDQNMNKNGEPTFNPRAALFVCNRWDMIDDDEKDGVRENVLEKLNDVWPHLEESQVRFISTTNAQTSLDIDQSYVIKDLDRLLGSLCGLFCLAQQTAVNRSYRWLKDFMRDSTMYLTTILCQIAATEKDHEERYTHARVQLDALNSRANEMILELRTELEKKTNDMMKSFKTMLSSPEILAGITKWTASELEAASGIPGAWESRKTEIDGIIINKIYKLFDSMEECMTVACDLRSSMLQKVKTNLYLLDGDMNEITTDLNGGAYLRASTSSDENTSCDHQNNSMKNLITSNSGFASTIKEITAKAKEEGRFNPRAFACRVIAPFVDQVMKAKRKKNESLVVVNPGYIMGKRAHKVVATMTGDEDILRMLVSRYTSSIDQQINSISLNIPGFIKANEVLMQDAVDYRKEARKDRGELNLAMELLEPHKELLRGFGCVHIKDIASDDVLLQLLDIRITDSTLIKVSVFATPQTNDLYSKRDSSQALWTTVQKADLTIDNQKSPVMIKLYINQLPDKQLFKEIAKLRCLHNPSIGTFLGMTITITENQSAFVFNGHLTTARRYLRRTSTVIREMVTNLLLQLVEGLDVIHRDELVHMEFSLDTVMVHNITGHVQLCNMCLPRKCSLPPNMDTLDATDFISLSPMVLRGEVYTRDADLYGFGIFVYEILLKKQPYAEQREWPLSRFVKEIHPSAMLNLNSEPISGLLSDILTGCIFPGKGLRLPLSRLKRMVKELQDDPCVKDLPTSRCPHARRRSSTITPPAYLHERSILV